MNKKEEYRKMNTIRSYKHKIYREEVNKKALGAFDDKRFILDNGIDCVPYGYCLIEWIFNHRIYRIQVWTK